MKRRKLYLLGLTGLLALGLVACGGSSTPSEEAPASQEETAPEGQTQSASDDTVITIGATPTPHEEILVAMEDAFAAEGYSLKIVPFSDYVQPNNALADGQLDANYFQHEPYLIDFVEENGVDLVSAGAVHYEPMAIFAGNTDSLDGLMDGAKVGVPNDPTNEARALLLLQENGLITLKEDAGIKATIQDIEENPLNLEIVELEAAQVPRSLGDLDIAVINGNYALLADLNLEDAMAIEARDSLAAQTYANIIAVRAGEENSDKAKVLMKVLTSDECKTYIEENYQGAVLPV